MSLIFFFCTPCADNKVVCHENTSNDNYIIRIASLSVPDLDNKSSVKGLKATTLPNPTHPPLPTLAQPSTLVSKPYPTNPKQSPDNPRGIC